MAHRVRRTRQGDTQVLVWLVLVSATVLTAVLGLEQRTSGAAVVAFALLGIAVVKVRLVGIHFMELGNAPRPLRALFEGYVALVAVVLVALYVAF